MMFFFFLRWAYGFVEFDGLQLQQQFHVDVKGKCKVLPYSLPSVGPKADPNVQAVSTQVTLIYSSSGRLPLLSARPAVTFPAEERHH